MLYKPKFCCNCGEKIERTNWTFFSSRRFCEVCETQYKGHDLLPRVIVGLGILIGLFGGSAYFQKGSGTKISQLKAPAAVKEVDNSVLREALSLPAEPSERRANGSTISNENGSEHAVKDEVPPASVEFERQPGVPKTSSTEPVYYCGALTKKGTPCSRRLKTKGRCWQHAGKPSAAEKETLNAGF